MVTQVSVYVHLKQTLDVRKRTTTELIFTSVNQRRVEVLNTGLRVGELFV